MTTETVTTGWALVFGAGLIICGAMTIALLRGTMAERREQRRAATQADTDKVMKFLADCRGIELEPWQKEAVATAFDLPYRRLHVVNLERFGRRIPQQRTPYDVEVQGL